MAKATAELFKNRIVGYDTKPADQFTANPLNYRKHPQRQRDAVNASLRELGWISTVVENVTTGNVIDGHERIWQALQRNEDVPYLKVELSEAEERLALAVFDPITNMAETDAAILDDLLREVNTGEAALQALLAELADGAGLYGEKTTGDTPAETDRAEELRQKWGVVSGQLWQLGEHRLICGDCTDAATVARVMGGEKAAFCMTDPPYGVKYTGGTKKWAMLENDDEVNMYAASFPLINEVTEPKAAIYVCYAATLAASVHMAARASNWDIRSVLVWNKNHAQFGAMGAQYKEKKELFFYAHKHGESPYWFGPNNEVTVWDIARASANEYHPTEKPPALYERALANSAPAGCIVYEPFSGSGTGIIACENTNRRCRAIEIDAGFVATTLERWSVHTGRQPVLVDI